MRKNTISVIIIVMLMSIFARPALAQEATPIDGPIYIIQAGDSLSAIASRFNISLEDLLAANKITDANNISAGQQLIIPGLEGVKGVLDTAIIGYGETLQNLQRRSRAPLGLLQRLNRITSPSELYAGVSMIIPRPTDGLLNNRMTIQPGESFLESAVLENSNPWALEDINGLQGTWDALPGDVFYALGPGSSNDSQNGMPSAFANVDVNPLPITQGRTAEITIQTAPGVTLSGELVDKPLHFFPLEDGKQVALQGVYGMLEPGPYPLKLEATLPDGSKQSFEQMILVVTGYYPEDPLLLVDPETIDPQYTEPEANQILGIISPSTPDRLWEGIFKAPAYFPDCFTSRYGNRRTYLGSGTDTKYYSFHTGLDFCGGEGLPITAPAAGKVVFAGPLTIRGNATIIDHGWGIYSGFWHQSKINVEVGQMVAPGDIIGYVGGTGRVTGAHLHWEIWVNGVQVNPMEWLEKAFP